MISFYSSSGSGLALTNTKFLRVPGTRKLQAKDQESSVLSCHKIEKEGAGNLHMRVRGSRTEVLCCIIREVEDLKFRGSKSKSSCTAGLGGYRKMTVNAVMALTRYLCNHH